MLRDLIDFDINKPLIGTIYFRVWAKWCGHCTNMKTKDPETRTLLQDRKDVEMYDIEDTLFTHLQEKHADHPFVVLLSENKVSIQAYPTALKWKDNRFSTMDISEMMQEIVKSAQ